MASTAGPVRRAAVAAVAALALLGAGGSARATPPAGHRAGTATATPIKHLVVIFGENVSFDHYFATYPDAANTDGTPFTAAPHTPKADNLLTAGLLSRNPNLYPPGRLGPAQAMTCDQNHSYGPEQYAADGGKADKYVENTGVDRCAGLFGEPGLVMDYYDGNTVTALWNYAQHYALNDASFGSGYGPSTPGALELVSGQTHGAVSVDPGTLRQTPTPDISVLAAGSIDAHGIGTVARDPDPAYDDCSDRDHTSGGNLAAMRGRNIGDLLNAKGVTWGWFQGGFRPATAWDGTDGHHARCAGRTHTNVGGAAVEDYSPHHNPFSYYVSTANPHHLAPRTVGEIGHDGRANHNYDLTDFDAVLKAGRLPAVSFLKAAQYQDGHAGYSDPIDEQHFLVREINRLQRSPQWRSTAVVVAYDDSDGWYDHVYSKPLNGSKDTTPGPGGLATDSPACQTGPDAAGGYADRCGPGTRLPLLVVSPYSRVDAVDHTRTEQTSITKFIEDNWRTGRIGDHSFDERAGTLDGMFDFRHPGDRQVLLNADGSVESVGPVPRHPAGADDAGHLAAGDLSPKGSSAPVLSIVTGAAVLAAGTAGLVTARRRRRS